MTDRESQEIIRMVESNWRFDLGAPARKMWRDEMWRFPAELGTAAVARLAKTQRTPPSLHDLLSTIKHLESDTRSRVPGLPPGKSENVPEWAFLWSWCRFVRQPRFFYSFPEQEGHVDPTSIMTDDQYGEIRQEWISAGSPRRDPVAAMLA